uniref:Uncharacterized protein n=1 Tax=Oryza barthii TaxID=65489 RepID=A0A0D3HAC8_9ORYZ
MIDYAAGRWSSSSSSGGCSFWGRGAGSEEAPATVRAHGGVLLEAHGGDGEGLVEALGGVGAAEQGVGHVGEELLVLEARGGPLDEVLLIVRAGHVDGAAAGDDLEEDDAEAVDVGAGGELAGESVLGGAVAVGAHDAGGDVGLVADGADLGEAEVGEAGLEGGVEEDVGGLEVAVDDGGTSSVVQVLKAAGGALGDAHPSGPVQSRGARGQVKQVVLQGAAGHYPSSVTRFGCSASRLSISTSTRNSRFPCIPFRSSCFTAASVTVPLMLSLPRYTGPNPPSPSSDSALNPPVASDSSPYVNARAVTFPLPIFRISSATRLCRFTRLLLLSLLLPPRLRSDAKFFFLLLLLLLLQPLEEVEGGAPSPSPSPSPPLSSDWKQQKMPIIFMVCWALHQRQQERILEPDG